MPSCLVVGGTGVTGSFIVQGLLQRNHTVTVLHSGRHKPSSEMSPWYFNNTVRILYSSPDDPKELLETLTKADGANFYYDHVFVLYGNLRKINSLFVNHCQRFYCATGMVVYDTWGNSKSPDSINGMVLSPVNENTPIMTSDGTNQGTPTSFNPKLNKIIAGQQDVFRNHPSATIVQYGKIYGPYNLLPHQWLVVKRILDHRKGIIVSPYSNFFGLLGGACYSANAAEYFLLAMDKEESKGEIFMAVEDKHMNVKQWIQIIANALGKPGFEIYELPTKIAIPARPLDHSGLIQDESPPGGLFYMSNEKAKRLLGYKDVVDPTIGVQETAIWLSKEKNWPSKLTVSKVLQDPFDYENEDELLRLWNKHKDWHGCLNLVWKKPPGWGHFFYGPGDNPGDKYRGDLKKKYAGKFNRDKEKRIVTNSKL